jgi:hypothetical protein
MVIAAHLPLFKADKCPHCGNACIVMDKMDNEPYCYICGWRQAIHLSTEQARHNFRCEKDFWVNLFAGFDADEKREDAEKQGVL